MYDIEETILNTRYNGLTVKKLASNEKCETLLICLEQGHVFPEHTSPRDALLVMLEGEICFQINKVEYHLSQNQIFDFPAREIHQVVATKNSKFLIIR